jgi:N-methylhydantoinase B
MSVLDPIKYEIFVRRLATVLEEGRKAIAMVSGSPAIVEGGECMTSFYDAEGEGILTASGTLFHVLGPRDATRYTIEHYSENPGIHEGDQFFFCDPYIAGTHLMDQLVIKPIFSKDERIAWVGTMTHTGDVGGLLRGLSTEIFHEGIRFRGIKIFDGGIIRKDVFDCITEQCRDPVFVSIDILARVASNNVCSEGFMRLVEKFGVEFIKAASRKLREDTEKLMRDKLRKLPDGTWRQRTYCSTAKKGENGKGQPVPLKIECALVKEGDQITIDLTGTSPQNIDFRNSTLAATRSSLFGPLCSFLFYDIPWNPAMVDWVKLVIPEGSFLNCRFPASCGLATECGVTLMGTLAGCIARMLYAAGLHDYVNASWASKGLGGAAFGPGVWYGGHNQYGGIVGQGIYDLFAGASGGAPGRDGVDTAGIYNNATSCISDGEFTEMYWPLLFLARRHAQDSGGAGKYRGGLSLNAIALVYGSKDLTADYLYGPEGGEVRGYGLFGGYPAGNYLGDSKLMLTAQHSLHHRFAKGEYPTAAEDLEEWGINARQSREYTFEWQMGGLRSALPEYSIISYVYGSSGGYGDPLDRDTALVANDIRNQAVTRESGEMLYGVILKPGGYEVDLLNTKKKREAIRAERLSKGEKLSSETGRHKLSATANKKSLIRFSEYLEIAEKPDGTKVICCLKCDNEFCPSDDNYKKHSLRILRDLRDIKKVGNDCEPLTHYHEYICPGCGTLLQVDAYSALVEESDDPFWDINIRV